MSKSGSFSVVLGPFAQLDRLSHSVLLQLLLYGDKDLPNDVNKHVLELNVRSFAKLVGLPKG